MKKSIINWTASGILGLAIIHGGEFLYNKLMPASHWFEYESVEAHNEYNKIGDSLIMVSTSTIKRPVTIFWNDILRCYIGDKDTRVSSYTSSFTFDKGSYTFKEKQERPWQYIAVTPSFDSKCYLVSNIKATVTNSINKTQTVISKPFYFTHEN
jgi:hypothetical protein